MFTFADVTTLTPTGAGAFTADIHPEWTIGGKPNGGYLLALLGAAAASTGTHPHVLAASAHYLAAPAPGAAHVTASVLRAGRSASQLQTTLVQDGRLCVQALVTTGTLSQDDPTWSHVERPAIAAGTACVRVPATSPTGLRVAIMDQVDLRLDPATTGFMRAAPTGQGELRGWLELPQHADFDPISLLYALDAFPPASFDIAPSGWVPTLEFTCYIRTLPAPGPVQITQRVGMVSGERMDEDCLVWDSAGRLVAQSRQLAGIRFA